MLPRSVLQVISEFVKNDIDKVGLYIGVVERSYGLSGIVRYPMIDGTSETSSIPVSIKCSDTSSPLQERSQVIGFVTESLRMVLGVVPRTNDGDDIQLSLDGYGLNVNLTNGTVVLSSAEGFELRMYDSQETDEDGNVLQEPGVAGRCVELRTPFGNSVSIQENPDEISKHKMAIRLSGNHEENLTGSHTTRIEPLEFDDTYPLPQSHSIRVVREVDGTGNDTKYTNIECDTDGDIVVESIDDVLGNHSRVTLKKDGQMELSGNKVTIDADVEIEPGKSLVVDGQDVRQHTHTVPGITPGSATTNSQPWT